MNIVIGDTISPADFRGMIFPYAAAAAPTGFLLCDGQAVSRTTYADLFTLIGSAYGAGDGSTTFNVPDLRSSVPIGLGQKTKAFAFVDGDVNTSTEVITIDSNDFIQTGTALVLSTSGTLPAGLSATTYYAIRVSATTIKLATTRANADDDTAVNITAAAGGGTHTLTLTLTDRALGDEGGEEDHTLQTEELASHTHAYGENDGAGTDVAFDLHATTGSYPSSAEGGDTPHNNMPPYLGVNFIIKT